MNKKKLVERIEQLGKNIDDFFSSDPSRKDIRDGYKALSSLQDKYVRKDRAQYPVDHNSPMETDIHG